MFGRENRFIYIPLNAIYIQQIDCNFDQTTSSPSLYMLSINFIC
jgi:hypothetical protein